MKTLTYEGETLTLKEWAARKGLNASTVTNRLAKGWSMERVFSKPSVMGTNTYKNKISKNEAERILDETPYDSLPNIARCVMNKSFVDHPDGRREIKYGRKFRSEHLKMFDLWYNETYSI